MFFVQCQVLETRRRNQAVPNQGTLCLSIALDALSWLRSR